MMLHNFKCLPVLYFVIHVIAIKNGCVTLTNTDSIQVQCNAMLTFIKQIMTQVERSNLFLSQHAA